MLESGWLQNLFLWCFQHPRSSHRDNVCLSVCGGLQAKVHHPNHEARGWQHHVVGMLCCRRDWCTSQNRWHPEEGKLKQHLKTSVRKLMLGHKWVFQMDIDPKHTSKVVAKWLKTSKSRYWSGHNKPRPQSHRKFVGRTEKVCVNNEAYKPDPVTPALSGGMGQNSPNFLWEACGRPPEMFKGSATKY